jgi:hypothetical protein
MTTGDFARLKINGEKVQIISFYESLFGTRYNIRRKDLSTLQVFEHELQILKEE